jgi:hypothetical protein
MRMRTFGLREVTIDPSEPIDFLYVALYWKKYYLSKTR